MEDYVVNILMSSYQPPNLSTLGQEYHVDRWIHKKINQQSDHDCHICYLIEENPPSVFKVQVISQANLPTLHVA